MNLKSIFAAALVAAASAGTAQATVMTWTVTAAGTITNGKDTTGLFGAKNRNLAGLSFSESITGNVDPKNYSTTNTTNNNSFQNYVYGYSNLPAFSETVVVDGKAVTFNVVNPTFEEYFLEDGVSTHIGSYPDDVYAEGRGIDSANKGTVSSSVYAYSYTAAFLPSLSFAQTLTVPERSEISEYASFNLSGANTVNFTSTDFVLSVNKPVASNVPEPTSIALFGLGLAGLGAMRRKKS